MVLTKQRPSATQPHPTHAGNYGALLMPHTHAQSRSAPMQSHLMTCIPLLKILSVQLQKQYSVASTRRKLYFLKNIKYTSLHLRNVYCIEQVFG